MDILWELMYCRTRHLIRMVKLKPIAQIIRSQAVGTPPNVTPCPVAVNSNWRIGRSSTSTWCTVAFNSVRGVSAIVHKDRCVASHGVVRALAVAVGDGHDVEVVVVVTGNGKVPHPTVVDLRGSAAVGGGDRAVGGLEVLALLELARWPPLVQVGCVDCTN